MATRYPVLKLVVVLLFQVLLASSASAGLREICLRIFSSQREVTAGAPLYSRDIYRAWGNSQVQVLGGPIDLNARQGSHYYQTMSLFVKAGEMLEPAITNRERRELSVLFQELKATQDRAEDDPYVPVEDRFSDPSLDTNSSVNFRKSKNAMDPEVIRSTNTLYFAWSKGAQRQAFLNSIIQDAIILAKRDGFQFQQRQLVKDLREKKSHSFYGIPSMYFEAVLLNRLSGGNRQLIISTGTLENREFSMAVSGVMWDLGAGDLHGPVAHLMQRAFADSVLGGEKSDWYFHQLTSSLANNSVWARVFEFTLNQKDLSVDSINVSLQAWRNFVIGLPNFDGTKAGSQPN